MKIVSSLVLIAALAAVGCTSTLSVGPQANSDGKIVDGRSNKAFAYPCLPLPHFWGGGFLCKLI